MSHKLMVADEPWHYRQVTYWDMPKCATCEQWANLQEWCDLCNIRTKASFGCVYHSSIPLTLPTPNDKA